jgi:hypothetical protein
MGHPSPTEGSITRKDYGKFCKNSKTQETSNAGDPVKCGFERTKIEPTMLEFRHVACWHYRGADDPEENSKNSIKIPKRKRHQTNVIPLKAKSNGRVLGSQCSVFAQWHGQQLHWSSWKRPCSHNTRRMATEGNNRER